MDRRSALAKIGLSALAGSLLAACDKDDSRKSAGTAEPEPSAEDGLVELLFVQKSAGISFDGEALTLLDVDPQTLFFSDRPQDIAGFLSFEQLVKLVGEGPDSFKEDPPNATLVVFGGDTTAEVVMELSASPRLEGKDMIFPSIYIIEGDLPSTGGASALFIDTIGRPLSPGSVAGVHRRHRRRRARRSPGPR
jgi:hypothetical protein